MDVTWPRQHRRDRGDVQLPEGSPGRRGQLTLTPRQPVTKNTAQHMDRGVSIRGEVPHREDLASVAKSYIKPKGLDLDPFVKIASTTHLQQKAFDLLGVSPYKM